MQYQNFIGGEWVGAATGKTAPDVNPADVEDVIGEFPSSDGRDASVAIEAAARAYLPWRKLPGPKRAELLYRAADILATGADHIARDLTREEGKTLGEAQGEVARGVSILRYYAGEAMQPQGEVVPSATPGSLLFTIQVPLGVVTVITPWNFPLAIPMWKIAAALAFGNTVVFKPASPTPLTAVHIVRVFEEAGLPPGAINLVVGPGGIAGETLVNHPSVSAVTYTGSNAVGEMIRERAHRRGIRAQLEMGGKNPLIVLDDAPLQQAVSLAVSGALRMAGQKCSATSRVVVTKGIARPFVDALVRSVAEAKVGDPLAPDTFIGPLITEEARQSVLEYVRIGQAEGATPVLLGGAIETGGHRRGYYVAPTVFTNVTSSMRIAQEEIFGPVISILEANDIQEAIAIANDVKYGLTASICTADIGAALRFVDDIEAGVVKINGETSGVEPQVPFGGMKASGSGEREQGKAARAFFTQTKTVYVHPPAT